MQKMFDPLNRVIYMCVTSPKSNDANVVSVHVLMIAVKFHSLFLTLMQLQFEFCEKREEVKEGDRMKAHTHTHQYSVASYKPVLKAIKFIQ